ncbi:MAG: hypothetical protein JWO82_4097, partial [Akkermansiaceae bacterium]|nr:hypothetical protein [Akkermansiaceae bacterium]
MSGGGDLRRVAYFKRGGEEAGREEERTRRHSVEEGLWGAPVLRLRRGVVDLGLAAQAGMEPGLWP